MPDGATEAIVVLAGPVAELLLRANASGPFVHEGTNGPGGDMFRLTELGLSSATRETARAEAEGSVSVHWEAIGAGANESARWDGVDGDECEELFMMNKK